MSRAGSIKILKTGLICMFLFAAYSAVFAQSSRLLCTDPTDSSKKRLVLVGELRSFHEPVAIRLEEKNGEVNIYWKIEKYNKRSQKTSVSKEYRKKLSIAEWNIFNQKLDFLDFWSMISGDYRSEGADGAIWMLEGLVNGKYHLTARTGYIYPQYAESLKYLLSLTSMKLKPNDIY